MTQAFCGDCNRARLSTEGKLYLCLFASNGHDLRPLLRGGAERRTSSPRPSATSGRAAPTAIPSCAATLPPDTGSRRRAASR